MDDRYIFFGELPGIDGKELKGILINWLNDIDRWIKIAKMESEDEKEKILAELSTILWLIKYQVVIDLSQRPNSEYLLFHHNSLEIKDNIQEKLYTIFWQIREAKFELDNEEYWGDQDPHKTLIRSMIFNVMFLIDLCSIWRNCGEREII